ncbi:MAG: 3-oxoacid CoA-transferase [Chloroflexi bacterium RBG_16_54_18]|nr:MAG: 3-oxoacid CoA-transferase [Chloroflexi bacterium RBG_16_54_18]
MQSTQDESAYNPVEQLICTSARIMVDHTTAFIGTGIPMLAAALAQRMHAPHLVTVFEFGGIGAILDEPPIAVGGEHTFHRALAATGICDVVEMAQRGYIDFGFLGGAQIDCFGNLNSTVIGDYYRPKARLPGSGGGNDVGSHCWNTIAIMRHDRMRFVQKLDFLTTPGYLNGPGARESAGLPTGTGPYRVVTNLAVMGYHPQNKRMMLLATQPGVTISQVHENTSFDLLMANRIEENSPPTLQELRILREEVDRNRLYI